jgi:ferrous-iron efflux pump FieF
MAVTLMLVALQRHVVRKTGSVAIKADSAHYGSDFLVNASVVVALLLSAKFGWLWIDPAIGLAIAIFIALAAVKIGREALDMLMDREMDEAERSRIKEIVRGHGEVLNLHDLRTRVAGRDRFIQFHLELDGGLSLTDAHRISDAVEADIRAAFPEAEVIIHEDPAGVVERRATFRYH